MKKYLILFAVGVALMGSALIATGCGDKAQIASDNISKAADNFEVFRKITFINAITDVKLLEIEGYCNIEDQTTQLEVTCKDSDGSYFKDFLGLSDNVTYVAEQLQNINVSETNYRVTFKPEQLIPDINQSSTPAPTQAPTQP